ncbi:RRM domain-containing protein [Euroglyphus maynei]|uniref:RRM domain-containing protein n=1 Tax=Euroglyphus maynei TaxID=6958 RepID=A0A1Y3AV19_EURMA|nr:RRM domain-containing protein [Euroglyphus maynei]
MSYEEQQADELDALQAIYPTEFTLFNNGGGGTLDENQVLKFSIKISSEFNEDGDDDDDDWECDKCIIFFRPNLDELELLFQLPKNYPDVGPTIEILSSTNLEDCDELEIIDILNDMIAENIGIVMIFTLVTRASEWLNTLKERKIIERKEAELKRKQEIEEMERKKFEGTRVTVETFIAWKMKFDAEMAALAAKNKDLKKDEIGKLTGKEMFLQDKNLIDSDLNFDDVGAGDDLDVDVKVDESLFQDDEHLMAEEDD